MNRKPYRDMLDSAAANSLSRHTDLWPGIAARIERKPLMSVIRSRPWAVILTALLILLALSGTAYALGRALGYIPGVGVVEVDVPPLRILAEPVTVEQQGITVTVSKVIADPTRTFITYRVEGIPFIEKQQPACLGLPELILPDGSRLENTGGGDGIPVLRDGDTLHFEVDYTYTPIPVGVMQVTLALPCAPTTGANASSLQVPLSLSPAPADYVTPVVEAPLAAATAAPTPDDQSTAQPVSRSGLQLEKVLQMGDAYILIGSFTDGGDLGAPLYMSTASDSEYLPRIEDAHGSPVPFKVREDLRPDPDWDVAYHWAYEVPASAAAPLTITVEQVNLRRYHIGSMQFDTGADPQNGQMWQLDQPVQLGAVQILVESVTFVGDGYTFKLSSDNLPEGVTPDADIANTNLSPYLSNDINVSSTFDGSGDTAQCTVTLTTQGASPPTGRLTVNWGLEELVPKTGPWSLVWSPAAP